MDFIPVSEYDKAELKDYPFPIQEEETIQESKVSQKNNDFDFEKYEELAHQKQSEPPYNYTENQNQEFGFEEQYEPAGSQHFEDFNPEMKESQSLPQSEKIQEVNQD